MTATTRIVELLIPGTSRANRLRAESDLELIPVDVTRAIRARIVVALDREQRHWSLLIVSMCMVFAVSVAFSFRQRDFAAAMLSEALRPIAIAGALFLLCLHLRYQRLRRFALRAPTVVAEVVAVRTPREDTATHARLMLRYRPRLEEDRSNRRASVSTKTQWAELDGFSEGFQRRMRAGDHVSILYDPRDPEHVRVVERGGG